MLILRVTNSGHLFLNIGASSFVKCERDGAKVESRINTVVQV